MKNFTKLFTLLLMAAMSMGVMAETAILNWKMGENGADAPSGANSITGAAGCAAVGFTIQFTDGTSTFASGDWIKYSETKNYKAFKLSAGKEVKITLPSGYETQEVKFFAVTNYEGQTPVLSKFNGADCSDNVSSVKDFNNPTIITKELINETEFTFKFTGTQTNVIVEVTYRAQPTGDSYTFGYEADLDGTTLSALAAHEDGCANIAVSALSTSNEKNAETLSHGDETVYSAAEAYRNKANGVGSIKTKEEAETNDCGISYTLTIATGYQLTLTGISSDLYVDKSRNMGYEYVILNKDGDPIYSSEYALAKNTTSGHSNSVSLKADAVRNLTGEVTVKFYFWIDATTAYLAIKDFKVTGLVSELPGEGIKTTSLIRQEEETWVVNKTNDNKYAPEFSAGEATITIKRGDNGEVKCNENGIRILSGMTIEVAVPEGSYIDEVAFYNYGLGNNTNGYAFNLSVNTESEQVGTLQATKSGDYHAWNSGEVRESELTYRQEEDYGDFYLKEIRVTYRLKPATITYTRNHVHMNLNTLCFPYQIDSYTGATFYTMLYKVVDGSGDALEVVLQEHVGALEAGKPYFYVPEGTKLVCECSGAYTSAGNDGNGVYGSYTDLAPVTSGMYVTYNNQIVKAGSNVKLGEYRAYINMSEVEVESGAMLVPGRKLLRIGNASNAPQGVDETQTDKVQSIKVIRNGQVVIIRDNKMYNVLGQEL